MKQYTHAHFILRCIEIARNGGKKVSPNPMVGSVLVENNEIIGEGFHAEYGKAHAEVNTFLSVKPHNKSRIPNATLYVSLEPCNIFGKTPPCTKLIIENKVKKVVISSLDVSPEVNGNGVRIIENHGIQIIRDILSEEGNQLVKQRSVFVTRKRPYTILKLVISKDGYYASAQPVNTWLSSPVTSRLTHKWRGEVDAILVGTKTAQIDNPMLDTRFFPSKNPLKFVLDKNHSLPQHLIMFNVPEVATRITYQKRYDHDMPVKLNKQGALDLQDLSDNLYARNIGSLLVEGGGKLIQSYLASGLWDELRIIRTNKKLFRGKKIKFDAFNISQSFTLDNDVIEIYRNNERNR
jgi:diaminohydroxyphosphoribosylaminopyrimidine deaminase/5-amino-6-(5-phosphoribosylamino)uracil reductase